MDVRAKFLQLCLTLCNPMDGSPPGSSVHGILQARILGWVARPPPGDLPDLGIKPAFLTSPSLAGWFFTISTIWQRKCSKDATKVPKERLEQHAKMQIYTEASTFRDLVRNRGLGQPGKAVWAMRRLGAETLPHLVQQSRKLGPFRQEEGPLPLCAGASVAQPLLGRSCMCPEGSLFFFFFLNSSCQRMLLFLLCTNVLGP